MHYRHAYHAGNFADVFKHALLCALLAALNRKDKPWCFLDTHAGAGLYDLGDINAQRTGEWREGIARVLALRDGPPALDTYLSIVRAAQERLARYPGSPLLALALARPGDRVVLCERVGEVADGLR